jgi:hypothetical protein
MKKLLWLLFPTLLMAQSVPNGTITQGQVWTTAQWNAAWQAKADVANAGATTGPNFLTSSNDPSIISDSSGTYVAYNVLPVGASWLISNTYDSTYNSYGNIFQVAAQSTNSGTAHTVAVYGSGIGTGPASKVWGSNFAGITGSTGTTAIAQELDINMPFAGTGYGLAVDHVGANPAIAAVIIQSNTEANGFNTGILINNASWSAVSGSLIQSDPASAATYGLNFGGTFSTAEILTPSFTVGPTPSSITTAIEITGGNAANSNTDTIQTVGGATSPVLNIIGKGGVKIAAPNASGITGFTVSGAANAYTGYFQSSPTTGQGFGLLVSGGTNSSDLAVKVNNAANTATIFKIDYLGDTTIGGAHISAGTTFSVASGTGACATTGTIVGGAIAGNFTCTGTTGASTVTLTLPSVTHGYVCYGRDVTTPTALTQTGAISTTSVTLTMTSVSANDVIQFGCSISY